MYRKILYALGMTTAAVAVSGGANAQTYAQSSEHTSYLKQSVDAPAHALEMTLGTGYTQGFGQIQKGSANNINDVANAGIGVDLGVGYRISPNVGVGVDAQYQEFSVAQSGPGTTAARGMTAGVDMTYHFAPYSRYAPWVRVGTGYRMLWSVSNGPTQMYHGFDFLRLATGFDLRLTSDVAMGPMIGADLNAFLWRSGAGSGNSALSDPRVNTFVYAGVQGRFDIGGTRTSSPKMIASMY